MWVQYNVPLNIEVLNTSQCSINIIFLFYLFSLVWAFMFCSNQLNLTNVIKKLNLRYSCYFGSLS